MNYTKVQFISWEIHTGPSTIYNPRDVTPGNLTGFYPGICNATDSRLDVLSQCRDIDARVKFTAQALQAAASAANLDRSPNTLKVFIAPEFLYRGAGGAYLHDLLNGWQAGAPADFALRGTPYHDAWGGLFGGLKALVNNDTYKNWVVIFGTSISASFATTLQDMPGSSTPQAVIDLSQTAEIYNTALIQLGGAGNTGTNYASRKHYKSAIDFLKYYIYINATFMKDNTHPVDSNAITLVQEEVIEGGAVFTLNGVNNSAGKAINWGMEICLDHAVSGGWNILTQHYVNSYGRLRNAGKYVKIQLVPSAGMSLMDASIRLEPGTASTPNAYAINCDGLNNLYVGYGGHTQIWNGANGAAVPVANKLLEANFATAVANTSTQALPKHIDAITDTMLWTQGAGAVRVVNSLTL